MPTPTYTPLANLTLTSNLNAIQFSNIPSTYRDLILIANIFSGSIEIRYRARADTTNAYPFQRMTGNGTNATAASAGAQNSGYLSVFAIGSSTVPLQIVANFMDYSSTNKDKTVISTAKQAGTATEAFATRYASLSAIDKIDVFRSGTGSFLTGSTFALYGIAG